MAISLGSLRDGPDAPWGKHPTCLGMSLFAIALHGLIATRSTHVSTVIDDALQHRLLLNEGSGMSKYGIAALDS